MKKTIKALVLSAALLCLVTGCYSQDTTVTFKSGGGVSAEIEIVGNDAAISEVTQGMTYDELIESFLPQLQSAANENPLLKVEEITKPLEDGEARGIKLTASYDSLSDMHSSDFFNMLNQNTVTPLLNVDPESRGYGVRIREKHSMFGTTYVADGSVTITRGTADITDEEKAMITGASVSMTFKFPVSSVSFSGGNSSFFRPTFKITATSPDEDAVVNFSVFVPNLAMLLALLIIIILILFVIILKSKISKLEKAQLKDEEIFDDEDALAEDDQNFFEGNLEFENSETPKEIADADELEAFEVIDEPIAEDAPADDETAEEADSSTDEE